MLLALAGAAKADQAPKPTAAPRRETFAFKPKTLVDGAILQVIFGERALFRLDDGARPVLESVEKGKLAGAHPPGAVKETFAAPRPGLVAAALDGSAEKHASVLKVWNGTDQALQYAAIALVLHGQNLQPVEVPVCPVAAHGVRSETWPAPVVAVGLSRFKPASKQDLARCAQKKKGK